MLKRTIGSQLRRYPGVDLGKLHFQSLYMEVDDTRAFIVLHVTNLHACKSCFFHDPLKPYLMDKDLVWGGCARFVQFSQAFFEIRSPA